jgi:hypothetical protein
MKNKSIFGIAYLFIGLLAICVGILTADEKPCKIPSESQKKCSHPENSVSDCSAWPGGDCVGHSQYSINDFPDGTTPSDSGTTSEEEVDCYQETKCRNNSEDVSKCETAPVLPYVLGYKVVSGTGDCPTE